MVRQLLADVTGVDVLEVLGLFNPGQIPVAFDSLGNFLLESPAGSGSLTPLSAPFILPQNGRMQTTQGFNSLFGAFSDGVNGKCPPVQLIGPLNALVPASQNVIGGRWVPGTTYIPGDLVRSVDGRWWMRDDTNNPPAPVGAEPQWPQWNGWFDVVPSDYIIATVGDGVGGIWSEWTPQCANAYPAPDISPLSGLNIVTTSGSIGAGLDVYCRLAYLVEGVELGPWTAAIKVATNTPGGTAYQIEGPGGAGLGIPRWFAEVVMNPLISPGNPTKIQVFTATVATGTAAPADSAYTQQGAWSLSSAIPITVGGAVKYAGAMVPLSVYMQTPISAVAFKGEDGTRFMVMTRKNLAGSLAPIDPGAYIQISTQGELSTNILNIVRDGSGNVTATVTDVTDIAPGQEIQCLGCTGDSTFNGTFKVTAVSSTLAPEGTISWVDVAHESVSNDTTGTVNLPAGPAPLLILPPGNPAYHLQTLAGFTVASPSGNTQSYAGPYFAIPQSDPTAAPISVGIESLAGTTNLSTTITSISRVVGGLTQATVPNIKGFIIGQPVSITKFGVDPSFNESTVIEGVTPAVGDGGVISWTSTATGASTDSGGEIAISAIPGSVIAIVDSTEGLAPGQTVAIQDTSNSDFNQLGTLASIVGNVVTIAMPVTGTSTGGTMIVQQTLPTVVACAGATITSISRDGAGNVLASVNLLGGFAEGMAVYIAGVQNGTFNGYFEITSAILNNDGYSGVIGWSQTGQVAARSTGGTVSTSPTQQTELLLGTDLGQVAIINFDDSFLSSSLDITGQLTSLPAPPFTADASFVPSLGAVAYVDNKTYPGAFVFSNAKDPGNIVGSSGDPNNPGSGILTVSDGSTSAAVCVREMRNGEILALKADGGYAVNPSALLPSQWNTQRRWKLHGPVSGMAVALGKVFLAFVAEEGAYLYLGGQLEWISREIAKTWKRFNTSAKNTVWCEVDEDAYELKIGLPLDGATTPNYELVCSYYGSWGEPEVLNRYGKLICPREARKWSVNPVSNIRSAKAVTRTLAAPAPSTGGQLWTPTSANRANAVVTLTFPNAASMPPIHVNGLITVLAQNDPTFNVTNARVTGFNPQTFTIQYATPGQPNAATTLLQVYMGLEVAQVPSDPRINTKQFLYGMTGASAKLGGPFSIVSLKRKAGVVTAVVNFGAYTPASTELASVILDSCPDKSFNGSFVPTSVNGNTIQWNQAGWNATAYGGSFYTTVGLTRVTMVEPDVYSDDGLGIDYQYQPFLAEASPAILYFGGCRGLLAGSGTATLTPVTNNPQFAAKTQFIVLATPVGAVVDPPLGTHFERGFRFENEHGGVILTNNAIAGAWFALQDFTLYVDARQPGRRSGN